ncbi:putative G-protein coupled receptor 139 [Tubulanus polymorphus]|uniref:putative G-protein coupled receptor 139 n=1 Tax=Tubulanus polymorphus TaxID=672921 RepID=UPI003DA1EA70
MNSNDTLKSEQLFQPINVKSNRQQRRSRRSRMDLTDELGGPLELFVTRYPNNMNETVSRYLNQGSVNVNCINKLIQEYFKNETLSSKGNCTVQDVDEPFVLKFGTMFYAYVTPLIIIIGLVGNSISLNVFTSKRMKRHSASCSYYLAALSAADLLVLIVYVLVEWLKSGLPDLPGNLHLGIVDVKGACHIFLYLSYVVRFMSVWLLVIFTFERYIGVCKPLQKKKICTRKSARRIISGLFLLALSVSIFRPLMSGVYEVLPDSGVYRCVMSPNLHLASFLLDSIYGICVTLIPFIIVLVFNMMIVRKLFRRTRRHNRFQGFISQEGRIRVEFTVILLAISTCFITLNSPYFVAMCYQRYQAHFGEHLFINHLSIETFSLVDFRALIGILKITKTIFFVNYCINFFLYSITGAYFRREMRMVFSYKFKRTTEPRASKSLSSHTLFSTTTMLWCLDAIRFESLLRRTVKD